MTGTAAGLAPSTPLSVANDARAEAARLRAEWLVGLDADLVTAKDLFEFACTLEGRPLLRIPLRQVLLSDGRFGVARSTRILARIQDLLSVEVPVRKMTVAWLLDARTGGKRYLAWLESTEVLRSKPAPGYPYSSPFSALGGAQAAPARPGGLA